MLAARRGNVSHTAAEALAELCRIYWYPLYAYVRRRGYDTHQAEDLTQEFFLRLLAKNYLAGVDRRKGKFRAFLLASLKHFLANEWDRCQAQKRGGGQVIVPLDAIRAEGRYRLEPAHNLTPEKLFEQQWAITVLEQVLARLQAEFAAEGKEALIRSTEAVSNGRTRVGPLRPACRRVGNDGGGGEGGRPPSPSPLSETAARRNRPNRRHAGRNRRRNPLSVVVPVTFLSVCFCR